jgi:Ca2+/Na+ antiporter
MTIQFWSNDPTILLKKEYIFELWPNSSMCYAQKLNAITRFIIFITILGYILTMSLRILIVGMVTLLIIYLLFMFKKPKLTKDNLKEEFVVDGDKVYGLADTNPNDVIVNPVTLESVLKSEFKEGNKINPFSNVLLTQIDDDPNRKAAPPAFNPEIEDNITQNVKKAVQLMNPGIKNTDKQLYSSLWDKFELDNSNRAFFSTPNTRVTNDQGAYAKFLYGDMPSAKGSTMVDNIQREKDNLRYNLY